MSAPRLPKLPEGKGPEELSAWPGMGNRTLTVEQAHAYGLAVWKAAMEVAAKACDEVNATTDECPEMALYCATAVRALPLPEQGSPQ